MTIKEVYEFYFNKYEILKVKTEMVEGIKGKEFVFTLEQYKEFISAWEDAEVVETIFQTHYTSYYNGTTEARPMEIPMLCILYK